MDPVIDKTLMGLLGAEQSEWMMWPSERLVILGLLSVIKPKRVLELGCASGGLTNWLSQSSEQVVTVDLDPQVNTVAKAFGNVTPMCMTTHEAAQVLQAQGQQFDLTIIDADHSRQGVRRDLENAIGFSHVILLHDTFYPLCRQGMLDVLSGRNIYFELDLVPGGLQPDGMWGGIGIVMPGIERRKNVYITPRVMLYPWMERVWRIRTFAEFAGRLPGRLRERAARFVRRFMPISAKKT